MPAGQCCKVPAQWAALHPPSPNPGLPSACLPIPRAVPEEVEYRVEVALLPLRLQLEQGTVAFLQRFLAPLLDTLGEPGVLVEHADAQAGPADFESGICGPSAHRG
jgi:hypothetical protein